MNPNKEMVVGGKPFTQDWSEDMLKKCQDSRLDIRLKDAVQESEQCDMKCYNERRMKDILVDARSSSSIHNNSVVRSTSFSESQAKKHQEDLAVTAAAKAAFHAQKAKAFEEAEERRLFLLRQHLSAQKTRRDDDFDKQYAELKETYQSLVVDHVDKKLERFQTVDLRKKDDLCRTYVV